MPAGRAADQQGQRVQRVDENGPRGRAVDEHGPRGRAGGGQGPLGGRPTRRAAGRAAEEKASQIDGHAPGVGQQPSRVVPLPSFPPGRLFI